MTHTANVSDHIGQILRSPKLREGLAERLWAGIDRRTRGECWPWLGRKRGRYGAIIVHGKWEEGTHRLAFAFHHERSPFPFSVCHTCDNPACCNPGHLFIGTAADNAADMMAKGRHKPSPQPGERNPRARLTEAEVDGIRARIAAGETNTRIAPDYGVSHSMVSRIRRGSSWGGKPVGPKYESLRQSPYGR